MTAKVIDLQTQLEELQTKYQQRLQQEENPGNDKVRGTGLRFTHFLKTLLFLLFDSPTNIHTYLIVILTKTFQERDSCLHFIDGETRVQRG